MFIPEDDYLKIIEVIPIPCVDLLIVHQRRCLLLRRNNEPGKGHYWFPGGRIFKMEKLSDAAIRKAKEEINLKCKFEKIISVEETIFEKQGQMSTDIHTINICCYLTAESISNMKIDKYHDEFIWVTHENFVDFDLHPAVARPLMSLFGHQ